MYRTYSVLLFCYCQELLLLTIFDDFYFSFGFCVGLQYVPPAEYFMLKLLNFNINFFYYLSTFLVIFPLFHYHCFSVLYFLFHFGYTLQCIHFQHHVELFLIEIQSFSVLLRNTFLSPLFPTLCSRGYWTNNKIERSKCKMEIFRLTSSRTFGRIMHCIDFYVSEC